MSDQPAENILDEGLLTPIAESSDDASLPDIFRNSLRDSDISIPLPVPVGKQEYPNMIGILTDTTPARSKSRRKNKAKKHVLKDSSSEVNDSLSDIFEDPVSLEITSEEPSDTPGGTSEEAITMIAPTPLRDEEDDLEPLLADDDSREGVTDLDGQTGWRRSGGDSTIGGRRSELRTGEVDEILQEDAGIGGSPDASPAGRDRGATWNESGDEEMECGSVSSLDANTFKSETGTGRNIGARQRADASPDEGVVNSSESEVSPSRSRVLKSSSGVCEVGGNDGKEPATLHPGPGKTGGRKKHHMVLLETDSSGDDEAAKLPAPPRKLRNRNTVSSQSEEGSMEDDVMRCKEESRKNRLKIVVSPDLLKKYSPAKIGQNMSMDLDIGTVSLAEDSTGIDAHGEEMETENTTAAAEQKDSVAAEEKQQQTEALPVTLDPETTGDADKPQSEKDEQVDSTATSTGISENSQSDQNDSKESEEEESKTKKIKVQKDHLDKTKSKKSHKMDSTATSTGISENSQSDQNDSKESEREDSKTKKIKVQKDHSDKTKSKKSHKMDSTATSTGISENSQSDQNDSKESEGEESKTKKIKVQKDHSDKTKSKKSHKTESTATSTEISGNSQSDQNDSKESEEVGSETKKTKVQKNDSAKTKSKKSHKKYFSSPKKDDGNDNSLKLTIKKVQVQVGESDLDSAQDTRRTKKSKNKKADIATSTEDTSNKSASEQSSDNSMLNATSTEDTRNKSASEQSSDNSMLNDFLPDFKGIRCTSCNEQLNQFNRKSLCKHPTLGVLICRRCIEYYYQGDFTKDDHGSDEQCQWCGEGGNLICCDKCPSAFCKSCICRNLSRKEWTKISLSEDEDWHCYVCDNEPISELTKVCKAVIKLAEKRKKSKEQPSRETKKRDGPSSKPSTQPRDKSAEQLRLFLGGEGVRWDLFQEKAEDVKKWANKKERKQLVQAVINIRKLRKYFKAYQSHFEHCLEEVMSSGELSGGEGATDSLTAQEEVESQVNSQESEEGPQVDDSKDEGKTPPVGGRAQAVEEMVQDVDGSQKPMTEEERPPLTKENQLGKGTKQKKKLEGGYELGKVGPASSDQNIREKPASGVKVTPKPSLKGTYGDDDICVIDLAGEDDDSQNSVDCPAGKGPKHQGNKGNKKESRDDNMKEKERTEGLTEIGPAIGVTIWGVDLEDMESPSEVLGKKKEDESTLDEENKPGKPEEDGSSRDAEKSKNKTAEPGEKVQREANLEDKTTKDGDADDSGSKDATDDKTVKERLKEGVSDNDGDVEMDEEMDSKSDGKERKKRKHKTSRNKSGRASTEKSSSSRKKRKESDGDDFEKLLMDEMDSDAGEDKGGSDSGSEIDNLLEDKKSKKKKEKSPDARKSLSYGRGTRKSQPDYLEDGSTSGSEVSLIDMDLADALVRKGKKNKGKRGKILFDSDTDAEIERIVKKPKKKKRKRSSSEGGEEEEGSEKEEKPSKSKKSEKHRKEAKRRKKDGGSSSNIDDEIDRLDMADPASGSAKEDTKEEGKKAKKSSDGEDEVADSKEGKKRRKRKEKKKKEDSELSSSEDDDDEELPEINYDTDPEMLLNSEKKKNDKKSQKLENAEEDLAEKRLLEELDDVESGKEPLDSSSDEQGDGQEGGKKSKGKGGGRGSKKGTSQKKEEKDNSDKSSGEENDGSEGARTRGKKKAKVHRLLKSKLISSSSSSNSDDQEWNPRKKKVNDLIDREEKSAESKKRGRKKGGKGGRKGAKASDSDFTDGGDSSSDSSVGTAKKKSGSRNRRKNGRDSSQASDSEDEIVRKIQRKKRGKATQSSQSDKGSSDDFAAERKKPRSYQVKGKKKSRVKKLASSNSDTDRVKEEEGSEEGSGDEDESPSKGKARKKIRKVMSKKKLTRETRDAAEEERERRKRVLKRRQELIAAEMDSPKKSSVLKELILDKDFKTKEVTLKIDKDLVKVLKPHQAKGIQFMFDCTFESLADADKPGSGCILAHCMGLGKTLQVIAFLHAIMTNEKAKVHTALVVAPLNTVLNWESEFEKWQKNLDEALEVFELASYKDNRSRADVLSHWQRRGGVMIMGYTMYRNLCFARFVKSRKQKTAFHQALVDPGPDIVICDEGHLLKNDQTATAKAMNSVRTKRRVCLTGTPLQNNLIEYHCMVQFVKPKLLGTRKEFSNRFVNPISNGQCADSSPYDVKLMKKRAHILHNLLSGSVQRKDYSALAPYLPPKHEYVVLIRLSPKQIELYELYLRTQTRSEQGLAEGRTSSLFKDYQSLMNVWTHPRLLKLAAVRTEKRRELEEIRDFVDNSTDVDTSDEEALVKNERDSSSGDELMKTIKANQEKLKAETNGDAKAAPVEEKKEKKKKVKRKKKGSDDSSSSLSSSSSDDGGGSDSSVEVIKTWNTRRTRANGEGEDFPVLPPPPKKQWFTDLVQDHEGLDLELSGKLIVLFEILKLAAAVGEKVLLFSQSLLALDLIEDILEDQALKNVADNAEKRSITLSTNQEIEIEMESYDSWTKGIDYFRIDGGTDASLRKAMCDKFNEVSNVRARLFLVSTRAGSLGINLVAASRVIIFDACWNPSHDIQSIFRVYRFGQQKAVYIYRFIAQGTMEERIYDRQVTKQSLAQRVVDEHQVKRHFTHTELSELYNFEPDRLDDPEAKERPTPILPKDFVLAELLHCQKDWIVKYHEHDSLLENVIDEGLTEEERKTAWKEYEAEKEGKAQLQAASMAGFPPGFDPGFDPMVQGMTQGMAQGMPQGMPHGPHPGMVQQRPKPMTMAAQLEQMRQAQQAQAQGHPGFMMDQTSNLQRILMNTQQQPGQQRNPVSLNQLFSMSQRMGQNQVRMGQPHQVRQPLYTGLDNQNAQASPPPGVPQQSQAYNQLTSQLIQRALASSAVGQSNATGQTGASRVITVPPNIPGVRPQGMPPKPQPPK